MDVTTSVLGQWKGDRKWSIEVHSLTRGQQYNLSFASREHSRANRRPRLVLTISTQP
jgi:hypothetical protein